MRPVVLLCLMVFVAGCPLERDDLAEERSAEPSPAHPPEPPPPVRSDTLWIEGMPESVDLHRFMPEAPFPLDFWTYVPPGWQTEQLSEEKTVFFSPAGRYAGVAFVSVRIYPAGMTQQEALQRLRTRAASDALATGQDVEVQREAPAWALAELRYEAGRVAGSATLTQYGTRYVEVLRRYPVELGDGFGPRARLIIDEWRWADTGQPLTQPPQG